MLVGRGASLTLRGVELRGVSPEAAAVSAAVRRRAFTAAPGVPPPPPPPLLPPATAAGSELTPLGAGGIVTAIRRLRRLSSPGRGGPYWGPSVGGADAPLPGGDEVPGEQGWAPGLGEEASWRAGAGNWGGAAAQPGRTQAPLKVS